MEGITILAIVCSVGLVLSQSFGTVTVFGEPVAADFTLGLICIAFEMRKRIKNDRGREG